MQPCRREFLEVRLARQRHLDDVFVRVAVLALERLNVKHEAVDRRDVVNDLIASPAAVDIVFGEQLSEVEIAEGLPAVN